MVAAVYRGAFAALYGGSAMNAAAKVSGNTLYIFLSGDLDEYGARLVRGTVDSAIEAHLSCDRVVLDLSGVPFMDSTGIGFLIGRYKRLHRAGTPLFVQAPTPAADRILSMGGLYTIIPKL